MISFFSFFVLTLAAARTVRNLAGEHFDRRQQTLPVIEFPYGTWQAASYDPEYDASILYIV